jgi:hypothetical protein
VGYNSVKLETAAYRTLCRAGQLGSPFCVPLAEIVGSISYGSPANTCTLSPPLLAHRANGPSQPTVDLPPLCGGRVSRGSADAIVGQPF